MCILRQAKLLESNPHLYLEDVHRGGGRGVLIGQIIRLVVSREVLIRRLL